MSPPTVRHTALVPCPTLAAAAGVPAAFLKAEHRQHGGSFKIRGATERMLELSPAPALVVTASAGNHGIGLALAARHFGIPAQVVVPTTAPQIKRDRIIRAGAELVIVGANFDESEMHARDLVERSARAAFVSSFDDPAVIAGNGGSLARELEQDWPVRMGEDDVIVVPVGGGGLAAGVITHFAGSGVKVVGVEPADDCAMSASFARGYWASDYRGRGSVADGLAGGISERTYAICREGLHDLITVEENEIWSAIGWALEHLEETLEGAAAVTLAALMYHRAGGTAQRVCAVLTGSNTDSFDVPSSTGGHEV